MDLPKRLSLLKSRRFIRLASGLLALTLLSGLLYNAIMVDRIPPTFAIRVSSTSSTGLAMTLTSIDVEFSEPVKKTTAESAFSITPNVGYTFFWQGSKLIVTPSDKLPLSTKFHVHIAGGIQDLAGNAQTATGDIDFTTVGAPVVASLNPAPGAQSVAVDGSIEITFDRLMDTQKVLSGLTLKPDITYQASWKGPVLTLSPTKPLEYGTTYTIRIGDPAVDTDGSRIATYSATFKTASVGLRATGLIPSPNVAGVNIHSQIAVTFDGPIDPNSISGAFEITPPVAGSTKAVSLATDATAVNKATATPAGSGPNVLVFTPDNPLTPHTTYSVTLGPSIREINGQVASIQSWTFTTGEAPSNGLNQIAFISHRSGVDNVWLMNPDGTNQREVTYELVPVSGYDVSGDGMTVAYSAAGTVHKMSLSGDNLVTLTPGGDLEYGPTITPDGTGLVVARRDANGNDMGYWRYSLVSGADTRQLAPDGAPGPGSSAVGVEEIVGKRGMSQWAPRLAITSDGTMMLVVRGTDDMAELVDMTGVNKPIKLVLKGNSAPVWVQGDNAFYMTGSPDQGATWSLWRVTAAGVMSIAGPATGGIATTGRTGQASLAWIIKGTDGSYHIGFSALPGGSATLVTDEAAYNEAMPSFSTDGSAVVFARSTGTPAITVGIWRANTDGTDLTNLSTDGSYPNWIP
ncbi:MAG TPA: Ig-like domain-containing protein [Candidatus Limnocylindrales bacterium]